MAALYHDPATEQRYDPIRCARLLNVESQGAVNEWIASYVGNYEVEGKLVAVIRKVFQLPDYESATDTGFTDQQALDLLTGFSEFLAKKP